jgi:ubiquinone/menaquinone biosynthesis C-methylase UbiE
VRLRLALDRWYLGLHGLALLRSYPFGDPVEAEARMDAMRRLLAKEDEAAVHEPREYEAFEADEAYERWAARYDEPNPLIVAEERALLEQLDGLQPGLALDVATGTGRIATHLVERGHSVVGCDRSPGMLRQATQKPGVNVVQADLRDLPFAGGSFDVVTCALALTHVSDLRSALTSFARVLREGGRIVLSEIHPFAVMTGAHAFFRQEDDSRAVTRNEQHSVSGYVNAALGSGLRVAGCAEALVDEELLREFGVDDDWLHPEQAVLGLPFAVIWILDKPKQ